MRDVNEIIIHCTATRAEWWASKPTSAKVAEIKRWHVDGNGWQDIGYHYLIDRDGAVSQGRPVEKTGAHCRGRNKGTIGVSLFGGHGSSERDQFADHYTDAQEAALRGLIGDLKAEHGNLKVSGHNQYAAKACPGFDVPNWFDGQSPKRVGLPLPDGVAEIVADADKAPQSSTTLWSIILAGAGTGWQAWQSASMQEKAIYAAVGVALIYVFRERLRKANLGKIAREALK